MTGWVIHGSPHSIEGKAARSACYAQRFLWPIFPAGFALLVWLRFCLPLNAQPSDSRDNDRISVECQWTGGFWRDRLQSVVQGSIPSMTRIMQETESGQFLEHFRIASGKSPGRHRGPAWNDGDCYKWLEAVANIHAVQRNADLKAIMDDAIAEIAAAQRDDGYLHTPVQIRAKAGDSSAIPFADAQQFELYNLGHLMTAACAHHRATGEFSLIQVAIRAADFLVETFRGPNPPLHRSAICPSHYMGLIELGHVTGRQAYIDLAAFLIDQRDAVIDGTDDNQDRLPLREHREVVGHAVRANYLYAGVAQLLQHKPDVQMLATLERLWDDVNQRKIYITGGCGALFDGASPDGSSNQKQISRTHQAFGRPYQLPNSTAHNESCAAVGNLLWSERMLNLTGKSQYADALERSLYNAILASISLDGEKYFYTNTLRQLDTMPVNLRWSRQRERFIKCFCCPPNVVRTIARTADIAYRCQSDQIAVDLFGDNLLKIQYFNRHEQLVLRQTSDYPWSEIVEFTFEQAPSHEVELRLRIPGWVDDATISVNGIPLSQPTVAGTYQSIRRQWRSGDRVSMVLPMPIKLMAAHPLVEEARNQVAIQRGPIVYCLESTDLPEGRTVINTLALGFEDWRSVHRPNLLGGVTVIECKSMGYQPDATKQPSATSDRALYFEYKPAAIESISCQLIPYYAWANRGASEMTVWLPLLR